MNKTLAIRLVSASLLIGAGVALFAEQLIPIIKTTK